MSGPTTSGPLPKRDDQRRRTNEPVLPAEVAPGVQAGDPDAPPPLPPVEVPPVQSSWHPSMIEWYVALIESQQSAWYEPSDWALARLWCDIMSAAWARDGYPSAALIGRWQVATTGLLTTEGDRRRLRIELARQKPTKVEKAAGNATVLRLAEQLGAESPAAG